MQTGKKYVVICSSTQILKFNSTYRIEMLFYTGISVHISYFILVVHISYIIPFTINTTILKYLYSMIIPV